MSESLAQNTADLSQQGTIKSSAEVLPVLLEQIEKAVPLDGSKNSYPDYFIEFVQSQLGGKSQVLVFSGDLNVIGDFEPKKLAGNIAGIIVDGNLSVDGNILNTDSNVMLFVNGDVQAQNVVNRASYLEVLGHVKASGLLIGDGNDGVIRIAGQVDAEALLSLDHDIYMIKKYQGRDYNFDETIWEDVLVPEVLEEDTPTVDKLLEQKKSGRSIFLK